MLEAKNESTIPISLHLPIIIVHAASLEVFLLTVTLLTLMRCGYIYGRQGK